MVSAVTRTGTMRPGPHTNSTVGIVFAGTLRGSTAAAAGAEQPSRSRAVTVPSRPAGASRSAGYISISSAASRE